MTARTCAACDCELDANPIKVKIGGKTVEVCCEECARASRKPRSTRAATEEGLSHAAVKRSSAKRTSSDRVRAHRLRRGRERDRSRCSCTACCSTGICGVISWRSCPTSGAASRSTCWRTATPRSRRTRTCRSRPMPTMLGEFLDALGDRPGGPRRQRQRRRHRADLRGAATRARAQPDAHRLRRPRQLAAGGVQAVPRRWRRPAACAARSNAMLADKSVYRSPQALGPAYEHPEQVTDETIETYLRPLVRTEQRTRDFQRFLAAFDCRAHASRSKRG